MFCALRWMEGVPHGHQAFPRRAHEPGTYRIFTWVDVSSSYSLRFKVFKHMFEEFADQPSLLRMKPANSKYSAQRDLSRPNPDRNSYNPKPENRAIGCPKQQLLDELDRTCIPASLSCLQQFRNDSFKPPILLKRIQKSTRLPHPVRNIPKSAFSKD